VIDYRPFPKRPGPHRQSRLAINAWRLCLLQSSLCPVWLIAVVSAAGERGRRARPASSARMENRLAFQPETKRWVSRCQQNRDATMQAIFEFIWNRSRGRFLAAMGQPEVEQ
jgi:hypothetical protein